MNLFTDVIKTDAEAQRRNREWIAALRSGEYAQATGYLRTPDGFCCLGVACDLIDPSRWGAREIVKVPMSKKQAEFFCYGIELSGLPADIQSAYCMRSGNGWLAQAEALTAMNDSGKTFAEIADVIERELTEALK